MAWLLDQRPGGFEAVVGANDDMAIGAMQELQARGIRIPQEVAVVGYDDAAQSRWVSPPLTTVPNETYKWGQQAAEMLFALIEGRPVPEQVDIQTELMVRESCGCVDQAVTQAGAHSVSSPGRARGGRSPQSRLLDRRDEILASLVQAAAAENLKAEPGQIAQVLDAFTAGLSAAGDDGFVQVLDEALRRTTASGSDVEGWHQVVSALRRQALPYLRAGETLARAEAQWQQARVLVGKVAQHALGYQEVLAEERMGVLREIGSALITTFDSAGLMDVLARQLPRLGIGEAYLALYEDPSQPAGLARLLLACNEQGRIEIEAGGDIFPAPQLLPPALWPPAGPFSLVAMPLYFRQEQLGFVMFEANPQDGPMYEALREQISSALQGALLVQRVQERSAELARQQYILDTFMENVPDSHLLQGPGQPHHAGQSGARRPRWG